MLLRQQPFLCGRRDKTIQTTVTMLTCYILTTCSCSWVFGRITHIKYQWYLGRHSKYWFRSVGLVCTLREGLHVPGFKWKPLTNQHSNCSTLLFSYSFTDLYFDDKVTKVGHLCWSSSRHLSFPQKASKWFSMHVFSASASQLGKLLGL